MRTYLSKYLSAWILVVSMMIPLVASAQLEVSVRLEHTTLVSREAMNVFVSLKNMSGREIVIDEFGSLGKSRMRFVIDRANGGAAFKRTRDPVIKKTKIPSDDSRMLMVNVADLYDFSKPGSYIITAVVEHAGRVYKSKKVGFDIVNGIEIMSVSRRIYGRKDYQKRIYKLRYLSREKQEFLFLCVEDDGIDDTGVFGLGPLVRVHKPLVDINEYGLLEIVQQSGVKIYTHSFFQSDERGVRFLDQKYRISRRAPVLFGKDAGLNNE